MDVKEIIERVKEKMGDEDFKKELKTDPVKAIEDATGVNLPDEQVEAVIAAVKGKLSGDGVSGIVEEAEEKLEGVKDKLEGLFHKDK